MTTAPQTEKNKRLSTTPQYQSIWVEPTQPSTVMRLWRQRNTNHRRWTLPRRITGRFALLCNVPEGQVKMERND